jgi:hypothetical protein
MTQYNTNSPISNSSDCNQGVVSDSNFSFSGFTEVYYLQIHQNCSNQTAPRDPSAARKRHLSTTWLHSKGNVVPVHTMQEYRGSDGIDPLIPNFGTTRR